ncbi:MAG: haloacid dehalogenase type II [Beijerinckiaceae bacterium]
MASQLYVFDAYGTLFDVHSAVAAMRERIGPQAARLSDIWRTKQLEYTWVRTLAGAYMDFRALTAQALDFAAAQCGGLDARLRDDLLASYETLAAYPDVHPALERLEKQGIATAILSNGSPSMLENATSAARIGRLIGRTISVDAIGRYKTAAEVYGLAIARTGLEPAQVSFQSSNRWDIAGAKKFGFRTVWVNRTDQPDEYRDLAADFTIRSLSELAGLPG